MEGKDYAREILSFIHLLVFFVFITSVGEEYLEQKVKGTKRDS